MLTREELEDLAVRLEQASAGDRDLDSDVCKAVYPDRPTRYDGYFNNFCIWRPWPSVTTSTDATLALIGDVLPGWRIRLEVYLDCSHATLWVNSVGSAFANCRTPALALCAAFLRAQAALAASKETGA